MKRAVQPGFSLFELLVVLAIFTLLLTLVPPLLPAAIDNAQIRATQRDLVSSLRYARNHAVSHSISVPLVLDVKQLVLEIEDRRRQLTLPDDVHLKIITAKSEQRSEDTGVIVFYGDGSSSGGQIALVQGESQSTIDVDWLTGRITLSH